MTRQDCFLYTMVSAQKNGVRTASLNFEPYGRLANQVCLKFFSLPAVPLALEGDHSLTVVSVDVNSNSRATVVAGFESVLPLPKLPRRAHGTLVQVTTDSTVLRWPSTAVMPPLRYARLPGGEPCSGRIRNRVLHIQAASCAGCRSSEPLRTSGLL